MAVSRGVLLFCLVTLFISLCCIKVTEAHTEGCDHNEPNKGDQCREDASDEFADHDVDDTYKIVNKVAVTFTQRNEAPGQIEEENHVVVLGH